MLIRQAKNKYLLFSLALLLVSPMVISLHHAMVQHEVDICLAEGEHHVHEFHLNCDHDHYFNHSPGIQPQMDNSRLDQPSVETSNDLHPRIHENSFLLHTKERGPPVMIDFFC